jgi:predicted Holliday junction resolvase-like endonuclease
LKLLLLQMISILLIVSIHPAIASVCDDSLYQELKKRDLNSLTQNETSYMLSKDQLCEQVKKENEIKKVENENIRREEIRKKRNVSSVLVTVICSTLFGVVLFFGMFSLFANQK